MQEIRRMRLSSLICLASLLAASAGMGAMPAAAQVLPYEMFQPPKASSPTAPAALASSAEGFTLTVPPPATSKFHPRKAAPQTGTASAAPEIPKPAEPAKAAEPVKEAAAFPQVAPLPPPPVRPVALKESPVPVDGPVEIAPRPIMAAAVTPAAMPKVQQPLSNQEIVARANAYFTGLGSLVADFTQVGGDGRRLGGTLYLQRPGKLRFEYDPPATLEVIADGTSVAVRDKKLNTQDLYFIQQTPLKFLLREQVNLGRDIAVTGISSEPNAVRINLEDSSTLGGTSRIALYFDPEVQTLTQWRITDPQGYQTVVVLNKMNRGRAIDQALFRIPNAPTFGNNR
ncbi:outer-membrane lipoprotein carrier protein LolA [Microvirga puerhi]|uniref:Outer-membrane lipoprotein carrier protein LolA n=1 Tax=Microvirga puerhi TaxID=2876078 RepID=A0ABS7VPE3_9HYPH|nr:outer-membrane lipoprotein carrier protein LolA [Microvirga puerhi]MBZ6076996.1 outer-membrane lipoprotein carrier protein LolA [Microvirga puerhi]